MQNVQTIKNCQRINKHVADVAETDAAKRDPVEHNFNRCGSDFISTRIDDSQNLNIKRKTLDQDLPHDRLDDLGLKQLQAGLGVPHVQAEKN